MRQCELILSFEFTPCSTHHHAVGRDHRRWYLREKSPLFLRSLRELKRFFDPAWIFNPGVLLEIEENISSKM